MVKTVKEIKSAIDNLVRKQGNQGALKLGDILDDIVDFLQDIANEVLKAHITDVATFNAAVPTTATEIIFAFLGDVDLTGYTKSGSVGNGIDVYADGTKYAVVSTKIICAPENSAELFKGYTALTTLDLSNFDTANVTSFAFMFSGCSGLTTLDVSNFDTANATTFEYMFDNCKNLTTLDVSNFNTANATTFEYMFGDCRGLTTLDLSNFDTANVTSFSSMLYGCISLASVNLSNFNTANATTFEYMFDSCGALTTIIANDWSASVPSDDMFSSCTSLVGGNGTTYDAGHIDAAYAHIDVADNPGYFTAPA